ncbi:MAG: EAL domain-containing protein [Faecalibacterium sp.]
MGNQKQILVVEDNALNRAILCELLSEEYRVLEAENGQAALELLRQSRVDVALILLDVMMPVMDGYTFLDHIREDPELSLIPVIVTTQGDSEADEVAALAHGATDFVPKPYRPQVILHRVASLIKLRETAAMVNLLQNDPLTGLYTREFFYRKVREQLLEHPEQEYSIVCSNIENFKLYNDVFGTQAGDKLLRQTAENLRRAAGETGICGRYGADRFLCFQTREQEQRDRKLLLDALAEKELPDELKNVAIKWGIYEITDRTLPPEQMCDRALLAADSIKGHYNQLYAIYDDTLRAKLLREQSITGAMETALKEEQFIVYLQPKYSLQSERMIGAEALVRWVHPQWGFISPGEFIPLFEKNGFITRLDQYIWEKVCQLLQKWRLEGYPLLPVSVNVSRADVYQSDLVATLERLTQTYGVNPVYLHLEITESAYAESPAQIAATAAQLRQRGFILEMDDFGSGYSSLNMLTQMKVDVMKLDMKFVQNETAKPEDQSILRFVIDLAHWMSLTVVAEGVETRDQAERLLKAGCDSVQGYFFAKPMPTAEYEPLLKAQPVHSDMPQPPAPRPYLELRTLLLVDEDASYRASTRQIFQEKYRVLEANSGRSALEYLNSAEKKSISAMILSLTLPDKGAEQVLQIMRQDPTYWHIPVLATIPQCHTAGILPMAMDTEDFLCKCHPQADLLRRVDRLIGEASSRTRESSLIDEATHDFTTGLLNRRGLSDAMNALRREDLPLAVCLFDMDNLKKMNDTLGHDAGDRMLRQFAELLTRQTRAGDLRCRYGGDEFVLVLKNIGNERIARQKSEEICRLFREQLLESDFPASCSVGVAVCGVNEKPSLHWIEHADRAMYRAKRECKGGCCMWERTDG